MDMRTVKINRGLVQAIVAAAMMLPALAGWAKAESLMLENEHIAVRIDQESGAIASIRDKELDVDYPFSGIGFAIITETGVVRAKNAVKFKTRKDGVDLYFTEGRLDITLHYSLGTDDRFIEKWLDVQSTDGKPYFLRALFLEDMATDAFSDIHFHDDNTIWHCPVNLFLRGKKGGCFAGIAYPYWELAQKGKAGFRLGYRPNYQASAGETNVSEKYFFGVYRREGIHRYSQGPYPGAVPNPYIDFAHTGVTQHFKGGRIPAAAVKPEILDWGEVWAMQEFMNHVFPDDLHLPEDGYWIWQNGWWAGLFEPKTETLDLLKEAGIHDIMTAHTWYGRGNHPFNPPYLAKMRTEPMGFPKDAGIAGMPGPAGPAAGLHTKHDHVSLDQFTPNEFTDVFRAPPAMEAFHAYGQTTGVHVSSFSVPSLYFENHPEWASIDEEGKVTEYLFGAKVDCPASDAYMDHCLKILDHVFTTYKPRWWGFDGRWLSYWEVPMYRLGPKGLGFDTCYAKNHGHLPGDNLYKEWKNIQNLLHELKRRHPKVCLEQYYGLKRGEPWALRYCNAADNYYETSGAKMNRFQAWHNQNDRFRPVYKNYSAIFGVNARDFRMNVFSSISASSYCQIGKGHKMLSHNENREFLKKWRAWATRNHQYLKVKRDLFDCPGFKPIDGSTHIIKDRGFIFLFSNHHTGKPIRASIPMNRWIQLEENPEAVYQIKEVYPNNGKVLATLRYGDDFLYDVPTDSAVVVSLEPAPGGSKISQSIDSEKQVQIIPAFSSVEAASATRGPDRHYPFDKVITNGSVTPDVLSSQAHARLSGQEPCEGVIGKALRFKAGNKGIDLGDLGLQAPATLSFWIKSDRPQADGRILSQLEGPTTQSGALRLVGGSLQIWNTSGWPVVVNGLSDKGIWQRVAVVVKDDGTVTGYLNGKKSQTATSAFDFKGVSAGIGARFIGQYGTPFVGALDDVRISNRALNDGEIKTLYPAELFGKSQAAAAKAPKAAAKSMPLYNWRKNMVVAPRKRDDGGKLLPLQSYDETIKRGMSFMLDDHLKWFKAVDTLRDENGKTQMPWVYYSNVQHNGAPFPRAVDRFTSYPAFHHALNIKTFLQYEKYADDNRALEEAVKLADWDIAHSTPGNWAYGNMPYSTYEDKAPGGFRDKTGIMPDKAAILALAYLDLHEATSKARFLKAAEAIGHTLSERQRPDGTWPFRVDPKTEKVIEEYTSSVIYAVTLFEKLDRLNGNERYRPYRDKTWNWLLNGPIKTKEFRGFYEDIVASTKGRTNYDCLDTIRYLLANRTDDNGYLDMAKELNAWIEKTFLDKINGFEPAEGIREQLQCNVVMGIHSLNWASMLMELAEATGDDAMRQRAMQTANYTTYYLQPDNRIVVGFQYKQLWYSCHVGVILYLFDFVEKE